MTSTSTYDTTLQHLGLISVRRAKLTAASVEAERQVIHRAASDYAAGQLSLSGLAAFYLRFRDVASEGYTARWNECMPISLPRLRGYINAGRFDDANDGTWRGEFPFQPGVSTPIGGVNVVYVLYDADNVPCYVGSTCRFRPRLKRHRAEGKAFVYWMAYSCADRDAAYLLEDRLLHEHQPYLNRRAGR
jgi:hypothetical protein